MAVSLGQDHQGDGEFADINVTPFIDVTLVLLIIFIVAAPLSTVDVPVNLPTADAAPLARPTEPIFLTVSRDLGLRVGETPVDRPGLAAMLGRRGKSSHDERIYLRADAGVPYGDLMGVMNLLRRAGYLKIALVGLEDPKGVPAAGPAPAP